MKTEPIHIHRYTLRSRAPLNAVSERTEFEGSLIRVGGGVGCVHPWPELGDLPLDQQLLGLSQGKFTWLTKRATRCCELDGAARERGESLFAGLKIPASHYSMPANETAVPAGFRTVKLKASNSREALDRIQAAPAGLRVRIDFNELLTCEELLEFWAALDDLELRDRVEFIEDPVRFEDWMWDEFDDLLCTRIAMDRDVDLAGPGPQFRIVKPAVNVPSNHEILADRFAQRLVFTSYMDHPIGQMFAAFEAANSLKHNGEYLDECGLVTQHLFDDSDPFVAALGPPKPVLDIPSGSGLGFDDLLESLTWNPLKTSSF